MRLLYWDSNPNDGRTAAYRIAGERFAARHSGLAYEYVPVGMEGYPEKVRQAWQEGNGPDVIDCHPDWLHMFLREDWLHDLEPALRSWASLPQYETNHLRLARCIGGTAWFLPCDLFLQGVHYRADLIREAGLPDPRELERVGKWDFPSFAEYVRRLHDPKAGRVGLSLRGGQGCESTVFNLMVTANNGQWQDESGRCLLGSAPAVEILDQYTRLAREGYTQPDSWEEGYLPFAWRFYEGRATFMIHGDDGVKAMQRRYLGPDRYGSVRLPSGSGGSFTGLFGFGPAVWSGSPVRELAAQYACQFVEEYVENLLLGAEQVAPGSEKGVSGSPMLSDLQRPELQHPSVQTLFQDTLSDPSHLYLPPFEHPRYSTIVRDLVRPGVGRLLRGESDAGAEAGSWAEAFNCGNPQLSCN